jgi:hypothetical protein
MRTKREFATCDHPECATTVEIDGKLPGDWRKLSSTAHLTAAQKKRSEDYYLGSISLELCPEHTDFFDAHLPQTFGKSQRGRDSIAIVSCSCGANLGWTHSQYILAGGRPGEPRHLPEHKWWRHLPADLRAYNIQRDGEPSDDRH